ncbi:lipoate--protein ligase family protein [bacterium]|nr:lipoate--protein ligase family protein [bacterium]
MTSFRLNYLETPKLSVAEQIALDRELMSEVGKKARPPLLRFYNFTDEAIVLGLSQDEEKYVDKAAAEKDGVPVLRRFSGGGAVFIHKGCLVYTIVTNLAPPFRRFDVMGAYRTAFAPLIKAFQNQGLNLEFHEPCDLAIAGRKVAGNAQSQRQGALLMHGSFLIDPDIQRIKRYLKEPDVRPDYRAARSHEDFLLPLSEVGFDEQKLKGLLVSVWC